jgi:hypothetical protein
MILNEVFTIGITHLKIKKKEGTICQLDMLPQQ